MDKENILNFIVSMYRKDYKNNDNPYVLQRDYIFYLKSINYNFFKFDITCLGFDLRIYKEEEKYIAGILFREEEIKILYEFPLESFNFNFSEGKFIANFSVKFFESETILNFIKLLDSIPQI